MPTIVTATELRTILGVSSSLYSDSYLGDIVDASENLVLPMLVTFQSKINKVKLENNVAYFETATIQEQLTSAIHNAVDKICENNIGVIVTVVATHNCVSHSIHFYKDWYKIVDSTNYNLYLNRYKEMLKTAHHLSQLLKKTREENAMLRAELDKKTGLEGNH